MFFCRELTRNASKAFWRPGSKGNRNSRAETDSNTKSTHEIVTEERDMPEGRNRRDFLKNVTLATGLAALGGVWTEGARAQSKSPNEMLNTAHIGVGGQGGGDLATIGTIDGVNVVALCDVDEER